MSRYQAYAEYKDSGVEWLEDIPKDWNVLRTKYLLNLMNVSVGQKASEYQLLSLTLNGVIPRDISDGSGKIPADFDSYQVVQNDDLVFCLFDVDETPRTIGISQQEGMITGAYSVYRCSPSYVPKYGYYYFLHLDLFKGLRPFYSGLRKVVRSEAFATIDVPVPSLREQEAIANFLDHETAKIDLLIEKQQALIELLKEKRQAVISHAVTKGLNPNAPMKDSGVEWLGEVPEHWLTGRLSYQVTLLVDGTHHSPDSFPEGDFLYITAKNIKEHGFDFSNISYISSSDHREIYSRCSVKKDDVLYIKDGATAGVAMVNDLEDEFSLLSSVALIRPRKEILSPHFLKHHLNASVFKNEMLNRLSGGAMTRFTIEGISRFNLLIPPITEQNKIVEYIDASILEMDALIVKAEQAISFMQERRTALISAAVTGKIDVRDWQKPAQA